MPFVRAARGLSLGAVSFAWLILVLNPIQMLSVLVRPFSKPRFRALNRWCAGNIWGWWARMAENTMGIEVRIVGDPIPGPENALVLPNHQSMADVMVLLCLARRTGRIADLKWFVKDPVKWVPGPGWGMYFLDCVYVKRNWARDEATIHRTFAKYAAERIPLALVSFLEGTRKTPAKHAAAVAFARGRDLPVPRHTLVPRTKGFVATMTGLRDHLDAVHDVTIHYPDRVPSLLDCFAGRVRRVELRFQRIPVDDLPVSGPELEQWVRDRFEAKDRWLEERREAGPDPAPMDASASPC